MTEKRMGRPPKDRTDHCVDCGRPMVTQRAWAAAKGSERAEMKAEGFVRLAGLGRCDNDYKRFRRDNA